MGETSQSPAERIAVNLWLLEEVNVRELPVEFLDGRNEW